MNEASRRIAVSAPLDHYRLLLYVAGPAARSRAALCNLEAICTQHLPGRYHIEVIDLMKNPHLAQADNILAVPTLVRSEPCPVRRIIGNLSNAARVLSELDLCAVKSDPYAPQKGGSHV